MIRVAAERAVESEEATREATRVEVSRAALVVAPRAAMGVRAEGLAEMEVERE